MFCSLTTVHHHFNDSFHFPYVVADVNADVVCPVILEVLHDFHTTRCERREMAAGEIGGGNVVTQDFVTVYERGPRRGE